MFADVDIDADEKFEKAAVFDVGVGTKLWGIAEVLDEQDLTPVAKLEKIKSVIKRGGSLRGIDTKLFEANQRSLNRPGDFDKQEVARRLKTDKGRLFFKTITEEIESKLIQMMALEKSDGSLVQVSAPLAIASDIASLVLAITPAPAAVGMVTSGAFGLAKAGFSRSKQQKAEQVVGALKLDIGYLTELPIVLGQELTLKFADQIERINFNPEQLTLFAKDLTKRMLDSIYYNPKVREEVVAASNKRVDGHGDTKGIVSAMIKGMVDYKRMKTSFGANQSFTADVAIVSDDKKTITRFDKFCFNTEDVLKNTGVQINGSRGIGYYSPVANDKSPILGFRYAHGEDVAKIKQEYKPTTRDKIQSETAEAAERHKTMNKFANGCTPCLPGGIA